MTARMKTIPRNDLCDAKNSLIKAILGLYERIPGITSLECQDFRSSQFCLLYVYIILRYIWRKKDATLE